MKKLLKIMVGCVLILAVSGALFLYWPLYEGSAPKADNDKPVDAVLIGGGIMSITLATYLQELQPDWNVELFERLDGVGLESSNGWNNAGTGHSAFAELNYTPGAARRHGGDQARGRHRRAVRGLAPVLGTRGETRRAAPNPSDFINSTPHMSFVWGDKNIEFLRKRQQALIKNPLFYGMQYSDATRNRSASGPRWSWKAVIRAGKWPPPRCPLGTDVNFGVITTTS